MTTINRLTGYISTSSHGERLQIGLIIAWVFAMIALPIMRWTLDDGIIPTAVMFALIVQFSAVIAILRGSWGWRRTLITFVIVAVTTWTMEFIGSSTGFPFGSYEYTDRLQPQLGHVPLLIPMAWFMMLPSAWALAEVIVGRKSRELYIIVSALALTAWDLFLDPQMVDWGFWVWENPVGYFGIPWVNYAGWLLTAAVATILVRPYRFSIPTLPLITIYAIVWFLQTFGLAFFWGMPGPAFFGSVGMGVFLVLAIRKAMNEQTITNFMSNNQEHNA